MTRSHPSSPIHSRWAVLWGGLTWLALATAAMAADPATADKGQNEFAKLPWQRGPGVGAVGERAKLNIPDKAGLLPEASGAKFLELTGNLPEPGDTILVKGDWWAALSFNDTGFIKDDEKLDADELLKTIKGGDERSNEERRKRGFTEIHTDGWAVPPHYDPKTKYLEWGLRLKSGSNPEPVINYTMRLLGRHGYESVVLVTAPETLDHDVQELRGILAGFDFNAGEKYSEFRPGDHVAEFGLGALVVGGVAAAAVKGGWFKGILAALVAGWKLVAAVVIAFFASIRKFLGSTLRQFTQIVSLNAEALLMPLVVALFLKDSIWLLGSDEAALVCGWRGQWRAGFGLRLWKIAGREPYLCHPLCPHEPVFRLHWSMHPMPAVAASQPAVVVPAIWRLRPWAAYIWFMLFVALPFCLLGHWGTTALLSVVALLYAGIVGMLVQVYRARRDLRLDGREFTVLAFEMLACAPYAANIVRRLSSCCPVNEDLGAAAQRLMLPARQQAVGRACAARIEDELELHDAASPQGLALRDRLAQLREGFEHVDE